MKRVMYFRLASNDVHLPKLVGAFVVFAALLMFLASIANMFESWNAVKNYPSCVQKIGSEVDAVAQMQYIHCKEALFNITHVQLRGDQDRITSAQFWSALLSPIAHVFGWAVVLILGIIFYRSGTIVIPIEQVIREGREEGRRK